MDRRSRNRLLGGPELAVAGGPAGMVELKRIELGQVVAAEISEERPGSKEWQWQASPPWAWRRSGNH
jgi:hypothetical protein